MVEGVLTFPLMVLVTLALVNLALAGLSASTAVQVDSAGRALEATQQALLPVMRPHASFVLPCRLSDEDC
jgi:hypothetical protein